MYARSTNEEIADALERVAALLETQVASSFRVRAYARAAETIRSHPRPLAEIEAEAGPRGLAQLAGVGRSIAALIVEYLHIGRMGLLDRLEGQIAPEDLFTTVPGIGEKLASAIHDRLKIDTLEELELAAHDGRLEGLEGFGPRRVRALRDVLAGILSRSTRRRARRLQRIPDATGPTRPDVVTLLSIDAEYRHRAEAGDLPRVAPRRFNPENETWLPIYHIERDGWSYTVVYSNSARAHELGRTHDWVVIYHERDGHEDQCTVVTEYRGPRAGQRVVRGREHEGAPRAHAG